MQDRYKSWIKPIQSVLQSPQWLLFLCFTLLFSLTYAGVFRQDDEHILAARAQSLALRGEWEEPQVYGNTRVQALLPLGDKATQIEPAHALLAAPLYRLGIALGGGGAQMMFLLNIIVTALSVTVVYAATRAMGYKEKNAAWTAILFGAGTMVWPFAATFYRDSLAMLMAAIAWLLWIRWDRSVSRRGRQALLLILALVGGLLAKNTNMALILALGAAVGWRELSRMLREGRRRELWLGIAALLGLGAAWVFLVPSSGPLARFSASYMLDLARFFIDSLNIDMLGALAGPLISPSKSIFLFSPPLLVGLAGLPIAWRKHRRYLLTGLLMVFFLLLGQGLFYRENWAGVYGWGLRYTLPILPVLMPLLVAPMIDILLAKGRSGLVGLLSLLLVGVSVQLAGVLPGWHRVYAQWSAAGLDPFRTTAAWDGRLNAILDGWKLLLRPETWNTAWVRMLYEGQARSWMSPIALMIAGCLVYWVWNRTRLIASARMAVSLLVILLPVVFVPAIYQNDPAWGGNRPDLLAALEWVNQRAGDQEPVVIDAYATPLWMAAMNTWDSGARWYSLSFEIPHSSQPAEELLSQVSQSLLEKLLRENGGLWYVISPDAPDFGYHQEAQWLVDVAGWNQVQQFGQEGDTEVWGFGRGD